MGMLKWFKTCVNNVYERRIRAASQVVEYGQGHGVHHPEAHPAPVEEEDDGSVISNVRPGTKISHSSPTDSPKKH